MAGYLLDTNHLSPLVTPQHPLGMRVLAELDRGHTIAFCLHSSTEMLFGISSLPRAVQSLAEWRQGRPLLVCYLPKEADAELAAELQVSLRRRAGNWQRLMRSSQR
jgi:tRNA(fMet)-specific endonuclease VapC